MKVKIKNWTPVAYWRWKAADDDCGICRNQFESCCPDCKVPGDDCPLSIKIIDHFCYSFYVVWGECSHVFHMHCLYKWINTESSRQQCPMDRRVWKTAT